MTSTIRTLWMALAVTAGATAQQTIVLEPAQDTTIFSNSGALSAGGSSLVTGLTGRFGSRRALLQFDLSGIPAGATIQQVAVSMTMTQSTAPAASTGLHTLLSSWGEGTVVSSGGAGGTAQAGDATWTDRFFGSSQWITPGGDADPVALATVTVAGPMRYTWTSNPALVASVQLWLDQPATNFGWQVITDETSRSAKLWNSREFAVAGDRPNLSITYTSAPVASATAYGTACTNLGGGMTLGTNGLPVVGTAGFAFSISGGPNNGAALLFFGSQQQVPSQPYLGCPAHIGGTLDFAALGLLSSAGAASLPLPIPNQPGLLGATVYTQAIGLLGNAITTSTAIELRLGL